MDTKTSGPVRVGFVVPRQPERHRVRVELRDAVTTKPVSGWLPVLIPRASADIAFGLPDARDQVLCLFFGNGPEEDFVLGSMYGTQTSPVSNGDKFHHTLNDGTTLEYDRAACKLRASARGDVEVSITRNVEVTLQGNGEVTAGGASELTSVAKIDLNTPALPMGGPEGGGMEATTQGNARHRGNVTVTGGDVAMNGISFLAYAHGRPHDRTTGAPK